VRGRVVEVELEQGDELGRLLLAVDGDGDLVLLGAVALDQRQAVVLDHQHALPPHQRQLAAHL
jgi:hypothetical protein